MSRQVEWWLKLLCLVPMLALACIYVEAALAARFLGHWPVPSIEDPKELPTAAFHWVSTVFFLGSWPCLTIALAVFAARWTLLRRASAYWVWLGVLLVSIVAAVLASEADPVTLTWWND
jgi:hypothetical protein